MTLGVGNDGQYVAFCDDRHVVTIAGSRAGKTATMLIPNLREVDSGLAAKRPSQAVQPTFANLESGGCGQVR
ncbi:type IV secretory system conjugative DNA transfer family protein [Devosia riboflavina]